MSRADEPFRRHAHYYQQVAESADQLYQRGRAARQQGWDLFQLERRQIDQARLWLQQHPAMPETDELLILYGDAISAFALATLCYDIRKEIMPDLHRQRAAARRLRLDDIEADLLDSLGIFHAFLGDYGPAIAYFEAAVQLARGSGDTSGAADYKKHLQQARKSISGAKTPTSPTAGPLFLSTGKATPAEPFGQGIAFWEKRLAAAEKSSQEIGIAVAAYELGRANAANQNYRQAIEYHQRALEICRRNNSQMDYFRVGVELALAYVMAGDYAAGVELIAQLVVLAQQHQFAWGAELAPLWQQLLDLYGRLPQVSLRMNDVLPQPQLSQPKIVDKPLWEESKQV